MTSCPGIRGLHIVNGIKRAGSSKVLQASAKHVLLGDNLGMTDTTGQDLDQHFTFLWHFCLNLFNVQRPALLLEHGGLVGLGN